MSHIVSLHFENPFKDSDLDKKLNAVEDLDIPISEGDHVEVVAIWRNEDGSIGIHVQVVEEHELEQDGETIQKIPRDDITTSNGNDLVLDSTPEMQDVEDELDGDFEDAAEPVTGKKRKPEDPKPQAKAKPQEVL